MTLLHFPVRECPSLARFSFPHLPFLRSPDRECPRSLAFFPCPHLSHPLHSPERECLPFHCSLASFRVLTCLPMRSPVSESPCLLSLVGLACHPLCALQKVSPPLARFSFLSRPHSSFPLLSSGGERPSLTFSHFCPHLPLPLRFPVGKCSFLALFPFMPSLVSLCVLQLVGALHSIALFPYSHLSLHLCLLEGECQAVAIFLFHVPTCLSLCALQDVSAPRLLSFFPCPHLPLPLHSLGCECAFPAQFSHVLTCLPLPSSL